MTMAFLAYYVMMGASALYTEKEAICQPGAQCSQEKNSLHAPGEVNDDPLDHSFAQLEHARFNHGKVHPFPGPIARNIAKAYAKKYDENSADLGIAIFQYCLGLGINAEEAISLETYALNDDILDEAKKKSKSGLLAFISVMDDYLQNRLDGVRLPPHPKVNLEDKIQAIVASNPDEESSVSTWTRTYPREAVYNMLLRRVFGDIPLTPKEEKEQDAALAALRRTAVQKAVEADLIARGWREIPEVVHPSYERMLHTTAEIRDRWHERQKDLGAV